MNERLPSDANKPPVTGWVMLAFSVFACAASSIAVWLLVFK